MVIAHQIELHISWVIQFRHQALAIMAEFFAKEEHPSPRAYPWRLLKVLHLES